MIDRDTQLTREEVRDNLGHPERTLAPLVPANPKPLPTADQLFTQPCIRVHNPALLRPWQRKPGLLPREHPLEGEDAWWSPEEERSRGGPDVSKERLRDPTFDESLPGPKRPRMDVSGESIDTSSASDQVSDHGPMPGEDIPPRRRPTDLGPTPYDSIPEEPGPEPDMPELIPPEESVVSPQQTTPPQVTPPQEKTPSSESLSSKESLCEARPKDQVRFSPLHLVRSRVSREELNSKLAKALEDHDSTTFDTQAPPEQVDRATAAHFFYICLAFNKEQKIQLHQEMPYGDIVIERGTRFATMQAAAEASKSKTY
ncbi:PREDICTED: uncharacterized protein LOC109485291 [Branchiostoma belcheri]|uniref:Uncharacterized protein LOC109485291 n=1 Tax=Branchiostoma belcheri TaxID=7741 RepID=A0A6P5A4F8_BRABE|nr:PREDICTED: uncharacterized protein LOC109485291 [Branchiostoma belcheri]